MKRWGLRWRYAFAGAAAGLPIFSRECVMLFRDRFVRILFWITLFLGLAVPIGNIYLIYPKFTNLLVSSVEDEALREGNHIAMVYLTGLSEWSAEAVGARIGLKAEMILDQFRLMKFKVFAPDGICVFSTEAADIGIRNIHPYFQQEVAQGRPYTKLVQKNQVSLEGQRVSADVVETYVPVVDNGRLLGAFELYVDISRTNATMKRVRLQASILPIVVAVFFLSIMFIVLRRLDQGIGEREAKERELRESRALLAGKNEEVEENSRNLQAALDEISSIIRQVSQQKDFSIRFPNPGLLACYELQECQRTDCSCYGREPRRCWQEAGTFCGGRRQGELAQKIESCEVCQVFRAATSDPIRAIGENFNNMMHLLETKNTMLQEAYQEVQRAQFQVLQKEKLEAIGQLAAWTAHEINNPLMFVGSNLELLAGHFISLRACCERLQASGLKEAVARELDVDMVTRESQEIINESLVGTNRIKNIVQGLLNFAGREEEAETLVDVNESLETTIAVAWKKLSEKAIVIREFGELPPVRFSSQQLNQVFMNLLMNAVQALEEKGRISVRSWLEGDVIMVSVADSGRAMPPEKLAQIFDASYAMSGEGAWGNISLRMAREIVRMHGGDISATSVEGAGSVFTVRLPTGEA